MALLFLILKTTIPLEKSNLKRLEISNDEINKFGASDDEKIVRKLKKLKSQNLSKSKNLKSKKLFKSRKSAKSKKKLLKSENSSNFSAMEVKPKFLIPNTRTFFIHL